MHNDNLKSKNFNELKEKVRKIKKRLVLDCDIILSDDDNTDYITIDENNVTIDGNNHCIDAKGKTGIFKISSNNVTLKNIVFKNAKSDDGSAIVNQNGLLKISNCRFTDNECEFEGGAILNLAELKIENSRFENNRANLNGGAVNNKGTIKAFNCGFIDNYAGKFAGAILNWKKAFLKDCCFENNHARNDGGAINNQNGMFKILNCRFIKNTSEKSGGSIINLDEFDMYRCEFQENSASECGGAISNNFELRVFNSKFINNKSEINGGAVNNHDTGLAYINKCEFDQNNAESDGGAINNYGSLKIENTRLAKNTAHLGGAFRAQKHGYLYIASTIEFSENESAHGGDFSAYAPACISCKCDDVCSLHYNYFCMPIDR